MSGHRLAVGVGGEGHAHRRAMLPIGVSLWPLLRRAQRPEQLAVDRAHGTALILDAGAEFLRHQIEPRYQRCDAFLQLSDELQQLVDDLFQHVEGNSGRFRRRRRFLVAHVSSPSSSSRRQRSPRHCHGRALPVDEPGRTHGNRVILKHAHQRTDRRARQDAFVCRRCAHLDGCRLAQVNVAFAIVRLNDLAAVHKDDLCAAAVQWHGRRADDGKAADLASLGAESPQGRTHAGTVRGARVHQKRRVL